MARALLLRLVCVLPLRSAAGVLRLSFDREFRAATCCVGASTDGQGHSSPLTAGTTTSISKQRGRRGDRHDMVMPSIVRIYAQTAEPNLALPGSERGLRVVRQVLHAGLTDVRGSRMRMSLSTHLSCRCAAAGRPQVRGASVALGAECDWLLQVDDDDAVDRR